MFASDFQKMFRDLWVCAGVSITGGIIALIFYRCRWRLSGLLVGILGLLISGPLLVLVIRYPQTGELFPSALVVAVAINVWALIQYFIGKKRRVNKADDVSRQNHQ